MPVSRAVFEKYLALGLSVFPVHFVVEENGKIGKRPSLSWKEFMTRRATKGDLDEWFMVHEPQGIGLATGELSGVVAVDIDTAETPIEISSSVVSKSAFSGGHHYLFKWSEEIRNTVKIEGLPVDFRGDGGYIVLPPSEYQGKAYVWEAEDFSQLKPLPDEIRSLLTKTVKKARTYTGNQMNPFPDATEGNRNATATSVAGMIIGDMGFKLWQTSGWLTLQEWNKRQCSPPLDDLELRTVFESVINMETRTIVKEETQEIIGFPKPTSMADVARERLKERELEKIAPSTGFKDLDRYIKGFIPGHVIVFTGDTNVGKTAMCCNFADRVSKQNKTVLYFSLEPENTIVDYLASVRGKKRYDQLTEEDLLESCDNISVYGKEHIQRVEDLVKVVDALPRYDLIIIDHIGYFTTDGRDMNTKQSNVMKTLAALAKAKQCAILLVAHIRKRQNVRVAITEDDISGSAAFKQDASELFIISRNVDEDPNTGNLIYTNDGIISVRKTKTGGGQGQVNITFKPGSALILDSTDVMQEMWQ